MEKGKRKRVGKRDEKRGVKREKRGHDDEKKSEFYGGFECGICFDLMSLEKVPRDLPCGHSYCSDCLKQLFSLSSPSQETIFPSSTIPTSSSSSSFSSSLNNIPRDPGSSRRSVSSIVANTEKRKESDDFEESEKKGGDGCCCPSCRKIFKCESVDSFDQNYLIPETIQILVSEGVLSLKKQIEDSKCINFESCGERTSMFCPNCEMFICDSCDPSHISTIFSRNHKRQKQQQQQQQQHRGHNFDDGSLIEMKKYCSEHSSVFVSGFCFRCSVFVCLSCVLETHESHKEMVVPLEKSAQKKRDEILEIGETLKKEMDVLGGTKKETEEEVESLRIQLALKESEIAKMGLGLDDLRMRYNTIGRLSQTPIDSSILDQGVFSTVFQTAIDIAREASWSSTKKRGVVTSGVELVSLVQLERFPWGMVETGDGKILVVEGKHNVTLWDKEGKFIREFAPAEMLLDPIDVAIGVDEDVVIVDYELCKIIILDKDGQFLDMFGGEGSEEGAFLEPSSVGIDEEGRIIIADSGNHRIQVFQSDGTFIRSFGSKGNSEGQFNTPNGIAIDQEGNIVVSDYWNHRIQVMDIEGNFIRTFGSKDSRGSKLNGPSGLSVDGRDRIVVADSENKRVCVFEKDGTFLFSFGSGQSQSPFGVCVDFGGGIIVSDQKTKTVQFWEKAK